MAHCFISYRRTPSAAVATALQSKLESKYGIDAYVDTTRTDGTKVRFPERLMQAIADAPVFICLLGERDGQHTLDSDWVLKEIQQAHDLRKFCIPVFQESYRPLPDMPPAVDYLLGFDAVHIFDQKNIMVDESVRQLADLIRPHIKKRRRLWVAVIAVVLLTAVGVGAVLIQMTPTPATVTPGAQPTIAAQNPTEITTPTLSGFQQVQTLDAGLTQSASTRIALDLTATGQFVSDGNATATAAQFAATETAAYATLFALSATPTPTPTATLTPMQLALTPVTANAGWTPFEQDFEGVTMVLVPAGCFDMGSEDGGENEQPVHEVCFNEPFWIDEYEVTNAQFAQFNGVAASQSAWTDANRPRERITWFEARDFCTLREVRLPTEAEWEYAARGPDNLVYPWGNEFVADNTVYDGNSGSQTAEVGSRAGGASWVSAQDMSGNVWEWVSSLYLDYPYGSDHENAQNSTDVRVLRGGSWNFFDNYLRAAYRYGDDPDFWDFKLGFRCARSFNSEA